MKIIFVADAHLKGLDDPHQEMLCSFLDGLGDIDTLVILGDLFEFWTGFNDVVYYHYFPVLTSLMNLRKRGVEIIYIEGNHDFSMGVFFTDLLKADVYANTAELAIDGRRFLFGHGDTIDKSIWYALWRGFLRSPVFRVITRVVPPSLVWTIALKLSKKSRAYNKRGLLVETRLRNFARRQLKNNTDVVVLAHSHVAGVYEEEAADTMGHCYANPGSWINDRSYLVYTDGQFSLKNFER